MWYDGLITYNGIVFHYEAKVYDEPSELGINNGRISKLTIIRESCYREIQASYSCGWDLKPTTAEAEGVLNILLKRFN